MPHTGNMNKLIKALRGFDKAVNNVRFLKAENGNCTAIVKLNEDNLNNLGGMHGGFSATLVDSVSSYGLMTHNTWAIPSVSVNINLSYVDTSKEGDEIKIISKVLRTGKNMAFIDVELRNANTDKLLLKAEHTKFRIG